LDTPSYSTRIAINILPIRFIEKFTLHIYIFSLHSI